jgi:hypothetical protein
VFTCFDFVCLNAQINVLSLRLHCTYISELKPVKLNFTSRNLTSHREESIFSLSVSEDGVKFECVICGRHVIRELLWSNALVLTKPLLMLYKREESFWDAPYDYTHTKPRSYSVISSISIHFGLHSARGARGIHIFIYNHRFVGRYITWGLLSYVKCPYKTNLNIP